MQRPTPVTVFGILNIAFAALGVFSVISTAVLLAMAKAGSANPMVQLMETSPGYATWMKFSVVLGLVVATALLISGIGLLNLKPWARTLSLIYGVFAIVIVIVNSVVSYSVLVVPMLQKAREMQGPAAAGAVGGAYGSMVGGCFGLVYPILLLIFMTRPNVVAAFTQSRPPSSQPPPVSL